MRISGGQWRGRPLLMPKSDLVRPTQDRVREALFNLLQPVLTGASFLDLFAGSGAVGLEALSRGAREATFCERDRTVFVTLLRNLEAFGVGACHAHNLDVCASLGGIAERREDKPGAHAAPPHPRSSIPPSLPPANILFADPPYRWAREHGFAELAQAAATRGWLAREGFFVAECDYRTDPEEIPNFTLLRDRTYGKTRLAVWRLN